jgi:hypothetical protein
VPGEAVPQTPEGFFAGHEDGLAVYRAVAEVVAALGPCEMRVSKSQIAFRRRRGFAYVWRPGQYITSDVPAVLSVALDRRVESSRFKQVAHPAAGVWMHHLELRGPLEVDDEVRGWLAKAWRIAG